MRDRFCFKYFSITNIILFLSLSAIQTTNGQIIAFSLFLVYLLIFFIKDLVSSRLKVNRTNLIMYFIWVFFVLSMLKFNHSLNYEGLIELFWLLMGSLIFGISIFIKRFESKVALDIFALSSTLIGICGVLLYLIKMEIPGFISLPYAGTRLVAGFDGPNEAAAFYLLAFTYSFNMYLFNKRKRYLIHSIFMTLIIVLTWSRGGLLGLVIAVCSSLLYANKKRLIKLFTFKRVVIFIAIIALLYFVFIPNYQSIRKNASARDSLIIQSLEPFVKRPFFGWGLGDFSEVSGLRNSTPHNEIIFILYASGLCGLLLFCTFALLLTKQTLNKSKIIEMLILLSFFTQEMTFNNLIRGRVSLVFWLIVLLIVSGKVEEKIVANVKRRKLVNR